MLTTLRATDGSLLACCEWWLVDYTGHWNPLGNVVWVNQLELSKGVPGRAVIPMVARDIADTVPSALGAYWYRLDKTGKKIHEYRRTQLVKEVRV